MTKRFILSLITLVLILACASGGAQPTPTLWAFPAASSATAEPAQGVEPASTSEIIPSPTPTSEAGIILEPTATPPLFAVVLSPLETMQTEASWILSLAWAPDNSKFLAGTGGGRARVLVGNPMASEWLLQIPTGVENVRQVTWSPDGATLAIAEGEGGQMFSLLDAVTGDPQAVFRRSSAICVAWSPDGQILAIGIDTGDLALWKPSTDEIVTTLDGGNNGVDSVAWSPDGKKIATSVANDVIVWSWDGTATATATVTATEIATRRLLTIQDAGEKMAWSPDGTLLATEGRHGGVWNAETGERLLDLGDTILPAWSTDSAMIVTANGKDIIVLDAKTGALLFTIQGHNHPIKAVAWSPDGTLIVSGDSDGLVMVWGVKITE